MNLFQKLDTLFSIVFSVTLYEIISSPLYRFEHWGSAGGGNGSLLQYPCLNDPMDSGACQLQSVGLQRVWQESVTEQQLRLSKAQRSNPRSWDLHVHLCHPQGGECIIPVLGPRLGKARALFPLFLKDPNDKGGDCFSSFKAESLEAQKAEKLGSDHTTGE